MARNGRWSEEEVGRKEYGEGERRKKKEERSKE
jgi:hypothetical protein